ncbi:hypothetical protein AYK20_07555 [Thermoplasmatales archaeon SG8-52-1]|nr:MAG: hypothetical protein AYK20_07555 [Thermoplasmatales archaeon SG8-52-1]
MKLKPSAILFDMDGVLVDSLDSWWYSLNEALKEYNHKEISRDEFIKKYWGHDLKYNLEEMGLDVKILKFCNTSYKNHVDGVKIYPDTKSVLDKLQYYKKGIITNTPRDCTEQILKNFNIGKYFEVIVTADEVSKGKPSPEIVIKACNYFKVRPENVILVGDTNSDIRAGRAAGCTIIGINIKADYTIKKLSELTAIVEN